MPQRSVLLLGATGEAGRDILDGLAEDGGFDVSVLVRPSSAPKPAIKKLRSAGFSIILSDLTEPVEELASKLEGFETVISAIDSSGLLAQQNLINAAAKAGTKRFLPCAYGPVCPPGGVMQVRDTKEIVFNAVLVAKVPYTLVDVGFWYQASFPTIPSGKMDYATLFPNNTMYSDGEAPKILTDKRDAGRLIARIIKDDRTLNRKVVTVGEVLSQKQTVEIVKRVSGERPEVTYVSTEDLLAQLDAAKTQAAVPGAADGSIRALRLLQYHHSMYVRKDNTPENARYLGYLDTRELYPDFETRSFENLVKEVLDGKGKKVYADKFM